MSSILTPDSQVCVRRTVCENLGKPWVYLGRGPDNFDCWGFVVYVMGKIGVQAPSDVDTFNDGIESVILQGWVEIPSPEPFSIVTFGKGGVSSHVGVLVDGNLCYHCSENIGVAAHPLKVLTHKFSEARYWSPNASCK